MTAQEIDYTAVFAATPSPCLVLTPDLRIVGVNEAYLETTGRRREELLGEYLLEVFPCDRSDPHGTMRRLKASVRRASATGRRDVQAPQKHDLPVKGRPGEFEERYWSIVISPVLGPGGEAVLFVFRSEDVTAFVTRYRPDLAGDGDGHQDSRALRAMEAELFARANELQELNEELRRAYERERQIALSLQRAMLPEADLDGRADVAVRYLPAVDSLRVCGDWYELLDLGEGRLAVAVGDVVGHGLSAARVMGQLRSSLSTAIQSLGGPARALEALGRYALSIDGALASTAVQVVIDKTAQTITYSCAGHLPPVLLQPDGRIEVLDEATHPPLGIRIPGIPRPQAERSYGAGATLVLYTDGLVERRGEDIDEGLRRLADSLHRHGGLDPESLAEALLSDLGVADAAADDTALIVIRP